MWNGWAKRSMTVKWCHGLGLMKAEYSYGVYIGRFLANNNNNNNNNDNNNNNNPFR